jgi:hypothetical protein
LPAKYARNIDLPQLQLLSCVKVDRRRVLRNTGPRNKPSNIGVTIVEPGAHKTEFGGGMVTAPVMEAYDQTPAGYVRHLVDSGTFPLTGDPEKTVYYV